MSILKCVMAAVCLLLMPAAVTAKDTVIKAAAMVDVRTGNVVSPAVLVIRGDRIAAINPDTVPQGLPVIDLGSRTLLPGFMDMHTHLTLDYFTGDHWTTAPVMETPADWALHGVEVGKNMLEAGFTTVPFPVFLMLP